MGRYKFNPFTGTLDNYNLNIDNQYVKRSYYEIITTISGQISRPSKAEILLDQWENGVDAIISTVSGGKPTYEDTGLDVISFDLNGNYTLSGTPTGDVAIIYYIKIPLKDLNTLDLDKDLIYAELKVSNGNFNTSAGIIYPNPIITDNGNGSLTIESCRVSLFDNSSYSRELNNYTISENTFTLINDSINYIIVNYNSGTPQYQLTIDKNIINESDIIPVVTAYRNGLDISYIDWDSLGSGLTNKLHARFVRTDRFANETGNTLSEKNIREIAVSAGVHWYGAVRKQSLAFDSVINNLCFNYHVTGIWDVLTNQTQYNNTQYDDGTDLVNALPNKYINRYFFRNNTAENKVCYVLGNNQYNSLAEAKTETLPLLPLSISNLGIYVGRIIVLNGADSGIVESAFITDINTSPVSLHNQLGGLQGGAIDEYYHLTVNEYSSTSFEPLSLSTDTTLDSGSKNIVLENGINTLTLNATPVDNTVVRISNQTTNSIIISGNGNNIYDALIFILFTLESVELVFLNNKWNLI